MFLEYTQHLWLCFWWTPWSYQDSYQTFRTILQAYLQRRHQRLYSPMCNLCSNQRTTDTVARETAQVYCGTPIWKWIAMDLAGPFPMSWMGNQHILVAVDYFSKWCEAYPVPTIDAPEIAQSLCGKLDLTLWCPIGAAHRPRKELVWQNCINVKMRGAKWRLSGLKVECSSFG